MYSVAPSRALWGRGLFVVASCNMVQPSQFFSCTLCALKKITKETWIRLANIKIFAAKIMEAICIFQGSQRFVQRLETCSHGLIHTRRVWKVVVWSAGQVWSPVEITESTTYTISEVIGCRHTSCIVSIRFQAQQVEVKAQTQCSKAMLLIKTL